MTWKIGSVLVGVIFSTFPQPAAGASADGKPTQAHEPTPVFIECHDRWAFLVDEWVSASGGLESSVQQTRLKISRDDESEFASIVRFVWAQQEEIEEPVDFGGWPVSDREWDAVLKVEIPSPYLPGICAFPFWSRGVFWHLIAEVGVPDKMRYRKPEDAPAALEWGQPVAGEWLAYWLFVRLPAPDGW